MRLQPAQAEPDAPRPWTKSTISAPDPHFISRPERLELITHLPPASRIPRLANPSELDVLKW